MKNKYSERTIFKRNLFQSHADHINTLRIHFKQHIDYLYQVL